MSEEPGVEREILSYELFGIAVRELGTTIAQDGYRPDLVLTIARGGLGFAMGLAYALDVKEIALVNVELYTGVQERLEAPTLVAPVTADLAGRRVLLADDVADTGSTLAFVQGLYAAVAAECRSAVLYRKPWSAVEPDYVWRRTDRWINFPWSWEGPVPAAGGWTT